MALNGTLAFWMLSFQNKQINKSIEKSICCCYWMVTFYKKKFLCAQKNCISNEKILWQTYSHFFVNECDMATQIIWSNNPWCHYKVKRYFWRLSTTTNSSLLLMKQYEKDRRGRACAKSFCTKMKATFEVVESSTYPTKILLLLMLILFIS